MAKCIDFFYVNYHHFQILREVIQQSFLLPFALVFFCENKRLDSKVLRKTLCSGYFSSKTEYPPRSLWS